MNTKTKNMLQSKYIKNIWELKNDFTIEKLKENLTNALEKYNGLVIFLSCRLQNQ